MRAAAALICLVAGTPLAHADGGVAPAKEPDGSAPAPMTEPPPPPPTSSHGPYFHAGQFGVSARLALLGLRSTTTYHDTDFCGTTSSDTQTGNSPECVSRLPIALELELSYGLTRKFDVLLEMKIGLEQEHGSTSTANDGPHAVALSPGLRYFFAEGRTSKVFTTAQAVFDFTDYKNAAGTGRGADVGVRNLNGLWFDLHPSYGFYLYAGETLSVARWVNIDLEAGIGFQARYP